MTDYGDLLATLKEPRPHITTVFERTGFIVASCSCEDFFLESYGTDESSKSYVRAAARRHEEKP